MKKLEPIGELCEYRWQMRQSGFRETKFSHTKREGNQVAHIISKEPTTKIGIH